MLFPNLLGLITSVLDLTSDHVPWTLENKNGSIKVSATVPGGVYSDLNKAGVIGDILYGYNDVLTRWIAEDTWIYTARFDVPEEHKSAEVEHLVFHGVDTVAYVELNDSPLGLFNNMFVRYVFDVKDHLKVGQNVLKVTFVSPVETAKVLSDKHFTPPACVPAVYNGECHANQLRKMQCSFGWDWGPAFPSVGIWKPVAIEFYNGSIIRSVTTQTTKDGAHWNLQIGAHLESLQKKRTITGVLRATLIVNVGQKLTIAKEFKVTTNDDGLGVFNFNLTISENVVSLWWPNGFGKQPLYKLTVELCTDDGVAVSKKSVQIGFRTIEVIEDDAALVLGNNTDAGKGLTFYFKVNGYPIFMKGSNWIPAHILPELGYNKRTTDELLYAARDAHMSMLRVWGGGVYESDYFYEKCDQLGILIWQDLLFACSMYPVYSDFLGNVKTEIEQTVIRLQHHASIAIWAGNNENEAALRDNWYGTALEFQKYKDEYIKLYVDTIGPILETLDPGRRYLVSSPSNGIESEQEGYIALNPYDGHYGDYHYYNYMSNNWDAWLYPNTRFASEYGLQSLPSLRTLRTATNNTEDLSWGSEFLAHRQHSLGGDYNILKQLKMHFKFNDDDLKNIDKIVYYSQISQAVAMKVESEFYRQNQADWYTMGALYWQLNDVWQAPSWSGIEFGGKWKMLHYFAKKFFAPVLVSPRLLVTKHVDVYLINDRFVPIVEGTIVVETFNWTSLTPMETQRYSANVAPLSAKKQDISIELWQKDLKNIFLRFSLQVEGVDWSPYNYVFPKEFKDLDALRKPNIKITVSSIQTSDDCCKDKERLAVDIETDGVVLFLWLETELSGRFEDNGLIITQPKLRIFYVTTDNTITPKKLEESITYQYYIN